MLSRPGHLQLIGSHASASKRELGGTRRNFRPDGHGQFPRRASRGALETARERGVDGAEKGWFGGSDDGHSEGFSQPLCGLVANGIILYEKLSIP